MGVTLMVTSPVKVPSLNCTRPRMLEPSTGVILPHVSSLHWASLPIWISTVPVKKSGCSSVTDCT